MLRTATMLLGSLAAGLALIPFDQAREAVDRDDLTAVRRLVAQDPKLVKATDGFKSTLLHRARSRQMAHFLVGSKSDVQARNTYGATPLHEAVRRNKAEVVKVLLYYGADPNAKMNNGAAPIHLAADSAGREVGLLLLGKGAKVNQLAAKEKTPLHFAAEAGNLQMVKLLLEKGADPDLEDVEGRTPLDIAKYRKECCGTRSLAMESADETIRLIQAAMKKREQP